MAQGKGMGAASIIAIAVVSTAVTILLDKTGVTKAVERLLVKVGL